MNEHPPHTGAVTAPELVRLLQVVAVAANEARTIEDVLGTCIAEVCIHTGWEVGHAYLVDRQTQELVPSGVWYLADPERHGRFREVTERTRLARGEGLVGRVAAGGRAEWFPDVATDPGFVRGKAGDLGVHAGLAAPILVGREVAGVLEFYSPHPMAETPELVQILSQVGVQIGRVVERARAEEALRLSEAKFGGIISISSDAIVSVDEQQRIVFFNQGAEQIFGYSAGEVLEQPLDLLIPDRFRDAHRGHVVEFGEGEVAARRMGERGQISGRRKNGEIFPADASISRIDIGGQRIYTAVVRDVTERVQAEQALARKAQELARSNAELEQFAYVASHDLQEPLRMVASYTQLLARRYADRLDDEADEFIGFALDGVTRMQSLINDLLAFSRVGTRAGEFETVDARAVVERVLIDLGQAVQETGAEIVVGALPQLRADPVQLGQVFQNLIANALKFRRPGVSPRVEVRAERDGEEWVFAVEDNGIGIAPEYRDRIFVLFQRLHSRGEYPGTGIGLALCKKIVERHGGRIWFESDPDRGGTTFHFSISEAATRAPT